MTSVVNLCLSYGRMTGQYVNDLWRRLWRHIHDTELCEIPKCFRRVTTIVVLCLSYGLV